MIYANFNLFLYVVWNLLFGVRVILNDWYILSMKLATVSRMGKSGRETHIAEHIFIASNPYIFYIFSLLMVII